MGKSKAKTSKTQSGDAPPPAPTQPQEPRAHNLYDWTIRERQNLPLLAIYMIITLIGGFLVGADFLRATRTESPLRMLVGKKVRHNAAYQLATFQNNQWSKLGNHLIRSLASLESKSLEASFAKNPSHSRLFEILREAVVREQGGYVHPDLGFLEPAPCGAARGIGMVRDAYHTCQTQCFPGVASEKMEYKETLDQARRNNEKLPLPIEPTFRQEEVLIRVPLAFQMTRATAMDVLVSVIPGDVQKKAPLQDLDDAALLVLHLAHERGVGRYSRWLPYIATLPLQPLCGYSINVRPYILDLVRALDYEKGLDTQGWPIELEKASNYATRIAEGLNKDYGAHIETPEGMSSLENIEWALCQVASRGTAGNDRSGALRLIPMVDQINHDPNAGGFIELTGKERMVDGDAVDATENDAGTFIVRSLRHGRRNPLKKGQELLVNYNVPYYTALDWLISLGFVPSERWNNWQKIDPVMPRIRHDGPFASLQKR